jgi:colicin import membrane protein
MTTQIQEYSATEAALSGLAERFKGVVYDVTTKEGMADAKASRNEIRSYRTALEAKRVEIKAPALERCRLIDAEAKRITAELELLENPIAAQIKKEEDRIQAEKDAKEAAQRARIAQIQQNLADIRELPIKTFNHPSDGLREAIEKLEAITIDTENFGDFVAEAETLKAQTLLTLNQTLTTKLNIEESQARLRAEQEEMERKQAEQREQEAQSRKAIEEEERAARMRIEEAERQARLAREEEERKARLEREAKEAEERKTREAEEAKQREIHRQENLKLDGRGMLTAFVEQYGHIEEFADVVTAINDYFGHGEAIAGHPDSQDERMSFNEVKARINNADSLDVLGIAGEYIQLVPGADDQQRLTNLFEERRKELQPKAA